jgi:hypothetical protein
MWWRIVPPSCGGVAVVIHLGVAPVVVAVWFTPTVVVMATVTEIPRTSVWAETAVRLVGVPLSAMLTGSRGLLPVVDMGRGVVTVEVILLAAYYLLSGG